MNRKDLYMKKIIALILALASLLSFAACADKNKYPPVESTKEEAEVLMTFSYEGEDYELKYELYRALFLNFKGEYDGGDASFWDTDGAEEARALINEKIISFACEIFATVHVAKAVGFDAYSKDADKQVAEYIRLSVEGSEDGATAGFGGDYDAYLASLKEKNLNYSVGELLIRYALAYDAVVEYYKGTASEDNPTADMKNGALKYTREDVKSFYDSDSAARVSVITINSTYIEKSVAKERRDEIASAPSRDAALSLAIQLTASVPEDVLTGVVIGSRSLDAAYFDEITGAALALSADETSELIEVTTDSVSEYWILYGLEKSEEHFNESYDSIEESYVSQRIGEIIENAKNELKTSKSEKSVFGSIKHSKISMS